MINIKKIVCIVCVAALFSLCVFAQEGKDPSRLTPQEIQKMRLISEAYVKMQMKYYKPIPLERFEQFFYRSQVISGTLIKNEKNDFDTKLDAFIYGSLQCMVRELRDPTDTLSKFIHKKYLKRVVRENIASKFKGIGIEVEDREDGFFVSTVYSDSSAMEKGVCIDDRIIMIGREDVSGLALKDIATLLNIPSGETIALSLIHKDETQVIEVMLTCRLIIIPSVISEYYEKEKSAYIRITEFRKGTAREVEEHLLALIKKKCRVLILDVRDNDGGDMEQAVAVCDLFLPQDLLVCYFLKRDVGRQDQRTKNGCDDVKDIRKVIILANGKTGSSAEIVVGALRHYNHYLVLGMKTKGMGAFKNTVALSDGSALYIITSRTYLPDDTTFDGVGLAPDIVVDDPDEQLPYALRLIA